LNSSIKDLEKENNAPLILDPVLIDITNQDITQHEILRSMACQDLQSYIDNTGKTMTNRRPIG